MRVSAHICVCVTHARLCVSMIVSELSDRSWGTPPVGTNANRSRSISDVSLLVRYLFYVLTTSV